jgi:hypothetical protein
MKRMRNEFPLLHEEGCSLNLDFMGFLGLRKMWDCHPKNLFNLLKLVLSLSKDQGSDNCGSD